MSEQVSLFDVPLDKNSFNDRLNSVLENMREKYGYYKMHVSGMYEMIKSASESELYDILELKTSKNGDISFYFDCHLYIKFLAKKETLCTTKELYTKFLSGVQSELLRGSAAPKGGVKVEIPYSEEIDFFSKSVEYLIKTKKPAKKFSCCSLYKKCSEAKCCLHENQFYAKGCFYRDNLENGRIFYGKNANC